MGNNQRKHAPQQGHTEVDVEKEKLETCFLTLLPQPDGALTKQIFQEKLFRACTVYSDLLYDYMTGHGTSGPDSVEQHTLQMGDYVRTGKDVVQLMNFPHQMAFYFNLFSRQNSALNREDAIVMLHTCCTLAYYCAGVSVPIVANDDTFLLAMWNSMRGSEEVVPVEIATAWCSRHCPAIWDAVHQCTRTALFGGHAFNQESAAPHPALLETLEGGGCLMSASMLWALSTILPSTFIPPSRTVGDQKTAAFASHLPLGNITAGSCFHLMYSSDEHGLSTNRFNHHVFSYKAPTLLVISFADHLYCVAVDSEWREGITRWGGTDCSLIQLLPVFKSMQTGAGMMYFNTQDRRLPKQLQVGTDVKRLALQIDAGFSSVKHYGIEVPLERLEVWGCGGEAVLKEQTGQKQWELKEADKLKNRKLKVEDWTDNPDKELLNLGGITTEHAER